VLYLHFGYRCTTSWCSISITSLSLLAVLDLLESSLGGSVGLGLGQCELASCLDIIHRHANDGTDSTSDLSGLLAGLTLVLALLVKLSPGLSPLKLIGLLVLENHGQALVATNKDGLSISTDELNTVTRIDPVLRKCANFRPKQVKCLRRRDERE